MAQRRMFSLTVTDSDPFQDMPLSTQALYFHLGMHADDDGFLGNARRIIRLIGASEDDFRLLGAKGFILDMGAGIFVIRHWKMCNYIQKDRYRPTVYKAEKSRLFLLPDNTYTTEFQAGAKPLAPAEEPAEIHQNPAEIPCIQPVSSVYPECTLSIGKDRLGEVRLELGKDSLIINGDGDARERSAAIRNYFLNRGLTGDAYIGTSEDLMDEAQTLTSQIFAQFVGRTPTPVDCQLTFQRVTWNGESGISITKDRLDLLLYAFEQASYSGQSGNWRYIDGVLGILASRGITTLAQAEEYDDNR